MTLRPRTRLWIQDDKGSIIFGMGRVRILKAIDQTGSMNRAAKEMGMSYRTIWGKIHDTQKRLGVDLIETGAGQRRGSKLTAEGRKMVERFEKWHHQTVSSADKLFDKLFSKSKK